MQKLSISDNSLPKKLAPAKNILEVVSYIASAGSQLNHMADPKPNKLNFECI